jgi:hypothetical protein
VPQGHAVSGPGGETTAEIDKEQDSISRGAVSLVPPKLISKRTYAAHSLTAWRDALGIHWAVYGSNQNLMVTVMCAAMGLPRCVAGS